MSVERREQRVSRLGNPLVLSAVVLTVQLLIWAVFMPARPTIPDAAPRAWDFNAFLLYLAIASTWLGAIVIGRLLASSHLWRTNANAVSRNSSVLEKAGPGPRYLAIAGAVALVGFGVGEAVYALQIVLRPSLIGEVREAGMGDTITAAVRGGAVPGVTSLVNLYLAAVAVFSLRALDPREGKKRVRRATRWLAIIGTVVLMHSILAGARMFFVYYLTILFGAAALHRRLSAGAAVRRLLVGVVVALVVIWIGETLRSGWHYSKRVGEPLQSVAVRTYVRDMLVQGYIAADFNNMLVLLAAPPSMQLVSTTAVRSLSGRFVREPYSYKSLPVWKSGYGTANAFGLWWFDGGFIAFAAAAYLGAWLGYLHRRAVAEPHGLWAALYLVALPGVLAMNRINYFSLTIYILPTALLLFAWMFASLRRSG